MGRRAVCTLPASNLALVRERGVDRSRSPPSHRHNHGLLGRPPNQTISESSSLAKKLEQLKTRVAAGQFKLSTSSLRHGGQTSEHVPIDAHSAIPKSTTTSLLPSVPQNKKSVVMETRNRFLAELT